MRRRHPVLAVLLAALTLAAVLAACGIESDSSPRELAEDDLPEALQATTSTTTPDGSAPTRTVDLWFLSNELLALAPREVEVRDQVDGAIEALLSGPTEEERDEGYTTSIPAGTELIRTDPAEDEQLLTINLSEDLQALGASELRNSVAQLVFTATSFSSTIERVRFQIDGEVVRVPAREGQLAPVVTRADYADLDPEQADAP
jgi:spore germination protein GerM